MSDYGKPTPVRLHPEMDAQLGYAAEKLHMAKQDVMRLAIRIGLEALSRVEHDLARAVVEASSRSELKESGEEYRVPKQDGE